MKENTIRFALYLLLFAFIFVSCQENADNPLPNENEYLIESELIKTYSKSEINILISIASLEYSDLADLTEKIQSGVKIYKITYKTTFDGETVHASGVVALPDASGEYPVLSYQNGTNTEHSNAPSVDIENQFFQILEMMGSTGFVVSLSDYLGFGEADDMFHPYLHAESTVQTVTDMLEAVREFIDEQDDISLNNDLYLAGYSQGGWATMQVQKAIEEQSSPSYNLKASACSGGPYKLTSLNQYVVEQESYANPYFISYIFSSYLQLGLTTPINTVFNAPYADLIPTMFDGNTSGSDLNAQLTTTVADLFTAEYLSGWNSESAYTAVLAMLDENSINNFIPQVPTRLYHGTADTDVPALVALEIYAEFIAGGASTEQVNYIPLPGLDHTGAILPSGLASILWFLELEGENM